MKELAVNPFADIYPMLPEDELNELAEDIKANGLVNPIVVKGGVLIDGRNRLAACKIAGVKPVFIEHEADLDDNAVKSLVISLNNNRRHLSKGQKAMAVAIAWPEAKRGVHSQLKNSTGDFDKGLLSMARKVLRVTPEAVQKVMAGTAPLSEAYSRADAEERRLEAEKREADRNRMTESDLIEERTIAVRDKNPDLYMAVANGSLPLDKAEQIVKDAEEKEAVLRHSADITVRGLVEAINSFLMPQYRDSFVEAVQRLGNEKMFSLQEDIESATSIIYEATNGGSNE